MKTAEIITSIICLLVFAFEMDTLDGFFEGLKEKKVSDGYYINQLMVGLTVSAMFVGISLQVFSGHLNWLLYVLLNILILLPFFIHTMRATSPGNSSEDLDH
ncbi:MAG: hypothetical protein ACSLFB_10025 [Acidimicrobiales bacterium]